MPVDLLMRGGATFSPGRVHRYLLWREWDDTLPRCVFLMLNPSTADEFAEDPTIRRCMAFARGWDCGRLDVLNVFAFRSTDPAGLRTAADPIGRSNDRWISAIAGLATGGLVCAWGVHGGLFDRDRAVMRLLADVGVQPLALGTTKAGFPQHPLYIPGDRQPVPYHGRAV